MMKNFLYIFAISEAIFLCIYLFSKGFLLSKDVIEASSTCNDFHNESNSCWMPKKYSKLIFILIDALRYDFAAYNESLVLGDKEYYKNNLKIFHDLQKSFPLNARLSRLIADAPTTTSQRIKGLTTGSLPTFIDASSNFGSDDIGKEDNIIDQLNNHHQRIIGLGDDTWMKLFPGRYHRSHFLPSFDINDLHTVDDGILAELYSELERPDWDILIAHFLGVDHCGHLFGARTKEMELKLAQMDSILRHTIELMDDETLLLVAGDHGMTLNGDHGGESWDEVTSALFIYSRRPIFARAPTARDSSGQPHTVDQIDLVPTIALLMGVPIPYSNIGTVMADMFADELASLVLNAKQIYRYLDSYRSGNPHFRHWQQIRDAYRALIGAPSREKAAIFFNLSKEVCRNAWSRFNVPVMAASLASAVALLLVVCQRGTAQLAQVTLAVNVAAVACLLVSDTFLWLLVAYLCYVACGRATLDAVTMATVSGFAVTCLYTLSNSYVVDEHLVGNFLVASCASGLAYRCLGDCRRLVSLVAACYVTLLTASRLGFVGFRCREEQRWCGFEAPFFHKSLASLAFGIACGRVAIAIATVCLPVVATWFLVYRRRSHHNNVAVILTVANLCFVSLYWLAMLRGSSISWPALLSYFITLFMYIYLICVNSKCKFIDNFCYLPIKRQYLLNGVAHASSQMSHRNRNDFSIDLFNSYAILLSNIFMSIVLIVSSGYALSVFLLVVCGGCALILHACHVSLQATKRDLFRLELLPVILWFFLSQQGFYVTGHQMTFSTIHWPAAFVGFRNPSNLTAGLLVSIDTFVSQILYGITTPLLFLAPFVLGKFLQIGDKEISCDYFYKKEEKMLKSLSQYCVSYIMIHATKVLLTSLAALVLRRHLMLWAIFAPHFLFEAIGFGVTCASVLLGYIFVASHWQV